jgi:hypothetical protein
MMEMVSASIPRLGCLISLRLGTPDKGGISS